jgi:glycerol-3-phosphate cytidylyltransferase-like family protein
MSSTRRAARAIERLQRLHVLEYRARLAALAEVQVAQEVAKDAAARALALIETSAVDPFVQARAIIHAAKARRRLEEAGLEVEARRGRAREALGKSRVGDELLAAVKAKLRTRDEQAALEEIIDADVARTVSLKQAR